MANEQNITLPITLTAVCAFLEGNISSSMNEKMSDKKNFKCFYGLKAPKISIKDYLFRIHKYAKCSESCFVIAIIYLERLITIICGVLASLIVHR